LKAISSRVSLNRSERIQKASLELIEYLNEMIAETNLMLKCIQTKKIADPHHSNIKKLKTKSELLLLVALGELFESEAKDFSQSVYLMIWAQIYESIERAIADTEVLSNVLEGASIKNV
jgi:uncharacterized protein Yka (UPF0111/DUF47 family)